MQETKGLFQSIVMLSTPQAAQAHRNPTMPNQAKIWASSGGAAFVESINKSLTAVRQRRDMLMMEKRATMVPADAPRSGLRMFGRTAKPTVHPQSKTAAPQPMVAPKTSPDTRLEMGAAQSIDNTKHNEMRDSKVDRLLNLWDDALSESIAGDPVKPAATTLSKYLFTAGRFLDKLSNIQDIDSKQLEHWQHLLTKPLNKNLSPDMALQMARAKIVEIKHDIEFNLG